MGRRPKVERTQVLAAARFVFAERGFDGATLAAIAARVGVSPAALLRHARSKQELFEAAMAPAEDEVAPPIEFLAEIDAAKSEPAAVLRRVGEVFVPFLEQVLGRTMALWMRQNVLAAATPPDKLPLLFDRERRPTPPQRAVVLLENYLRRATRARRLKVRDPRAAALGFLGALHAYVLLHRIARVFDPPLPLARYLDQLVDIWGAGLRCAPAKEKP
ncbi:MAG: TetR/AcrR family transcriptional regulator [Thermoanaerobaculia bacterium]